jgi:DNA-binding transcriptional ArsR family regulator
VLNKQVGGAEQELDVMFHALADPTRRAIVSRLCHGPATVSQLADPFPISLPGIVQHLQVLEASGLIRSENIGSVRSCSVNPAAVRRAENWLGQRRAPAERQLDRLEGFLAASASGASRSTQLSRANDLS